jgi:hypothetical protein
MLCGCGVSAEHLAGDLLQLAGRGLGREPSHVSLEDHVWSPVALWEPAPAVTSVALATLTDDVAPTTRERFLDLLQHVVAGEGTKSGVGPTRTRSSGAVPRSCRARYQAAL